MKFISPSHLDLGGIRGQLGSRQYDPCLSSHHRQSAELSLARGWEEIYLLTWWEKEIVGSVSEAILFKGLKRLKDLPWISNYYRGEKGDLHTGLEHIMKNNSIILKNDIIIAPFCLHFILRTYKYILDISL